MERIDDIMNKILIQSNNILTSWKKEIQDKEIKLVCKSDSRLMKIAAILSGPLYLWCWPKKWVKNWFIKEYNKINKRSINA